MKTSINALIANTATLTAANNFGFRDFASHEKTLERRMSVLIPKIKSLVDMGILDGDNTYVFFKNNNAQGNDTEAVAGTYDDIKIATLSDDSYLGGICFQTWGFVEGGNAHFYTIHDDAKTQDDTVKCYDFADWKSMKKSLKTDADIIEIARAQFNPNYVEPVVEVKEKIVKEKPVKAVKKVAKKSTEVKDVTNEVQKTVAKAKKTMTVKPAVVIDEADIIE